MTSNQRFAAELPRVEKKSRGRTTAAATPIAIRSRIPLPDGLHDEIRTRLGRKLAKYAQLIERGSVHIDDVNGPKGGSDLSCRIRLALSGLPAIVVEERGADLTKLLTRAANVAERTLRRELQRRGRSASDRRKRAEPAKVASPGSNRPATRDDAGSLIGGRVGRSQANLERALARPEKLRRDAYVDTAAPGTSASDRRAGYGATARRNTKRNRAGMTAALEDSRTTPSRKSSRKSANRSRAGTALERKASARSLSPKARAVRAQSRSRRGAPKR